MSLSLLPTVRRLASVIGVDILSIDICISSVLRACPRRSVRMCLLRNEKCDRNRSNPYEAVEAECKGRRWTMRASASDVSQKYESSVGIPLGYGPRC